MKVVNNNNKHGLMPHLHQNMKCQTDQKRQRVEVGVT